MAPKDSLAHPNTADTVLHPVRLRILQGLLGGRRLTTAQLARELPDVTAATLYRHVAVLAEAGILEVVSEQRIRGAVERTYALRLEASELSPEDLASMSPAQHKQAFISFIAGLLANFERYVDGAQPVDLARDGVGYRQTALWLTDRELEQFTADLAAVVAAYSSHETGAGRSRRLLTSIIMPTAS